MPSRGALPRRLAPALLVALAALRGTLAAGLEVPYLSGRVNDLAEMIPPESRQRVEAKLEALEQETGAQVAVLTVPSLEGDSLEDFSLRVAETWKLGREGVDDGALLLIARDDRKMRLEVGYGLEGVLTDALSGRILDGVMRPRFRAGDFGGGVESAVDAIAGLIRGEDSLPPPAPASGVSSDVPLAGRLGIFGFFLLVVGIFSLSALFSPGCSGWFLYVFLMPFWGSFPPGLLGAPWGFAFPVLWILGFPIARILLHHTERGKRFAKESSWMRRFATSSGRGWSSSGGWSSGGFSGGGGSFGGGGASSSW